MEKKYFPEQFAAAVQRRAGLLGQFAAVRLVDGIGDGILDLYVDCFGPCAVVHFHGDTDPTGYRRELGTLTAWHDLGIEAVFFRQRFKDSARSAELPAEIIRGSWKGAFPLEEHDVRYLIDPERHLNAGFFIDMRELRLKLKQSSSGKRVLNLFCYSGSLGISALAGGALEVVQVDISKGILSWVKDNLALNSVHQGTMRVIPEDSLVFMEREARRIAKGSERYDTIIIDPPSFSRSAQGTFQIGRDIGGLIERALPLLAPGGELVLTTNYSVFTAEDVAERIFEVAEKLGIRTKRKMLVRPPADFPSEGEMSIASRGAVVEIL